MVILLKLASFIHSVPIFHYCFASSTYDRSGWLYQFKELASDHEITSMRKGISNCKQISQQVTFKIESYQYSEANKWSGSES